MVGDGVVAVGNMRQMPVLPVIRIGRVIITPCTDIGTCVHVPGLCIEVEVHGLGVGVLDGDIRKVGARTRCRSDQPRLVRHTAVGPLIDVATHGGIAIGERKHLARSLVDNLIAAVDGLDGHIFTKVNVNQALGIGLTVAVTATVSARHILCKVIERTFAVIVGETSTGDEGEGCLHALTLGRTDEGLGTVGLVLVLVHRRHHPFARTLLVGKLHTVLQHVGVFTAGNTVVAPPRTGFTAVVGTHHGLHDVVHLVGNEAFPVVLGRLPKTSILGKSIARQLVSVGKVDIVLYRGVPVSGLCRVQRAGAIDLAGKNRTPLHDGSHSTIVGGIARIGRLKVRFVERSHSQNRVTLALDILGSTLDVIDIVGALLCAPRWSSTGIALLVTFVSNATKQEDFHLARTANPADVVQFGVQFRYLGTGQGCITGRPTSRKTDTRHGDAAGADVVRTAVVAHLESEEVPAPTALATFKFILCACVAQVVRDPHSPRASLHGTAGRSDLLCACKDWHHRQQNKQ